MRLVGCRKVSFKGDNGETVSGFNLYLVLSEDESSMAVVGQEVLRLFVTDAKLADWDFDPAENVGEEVKIEYTRYGKVGYISKVD